MCAYLIAAESVRLVVWDVNGVASWELASSESAAKCRWDNQADGEGKTLC